MSSRRVRSGSSAAISSACAWWPIIPCMNWTSAAVNWTRERSLAFSAEIVRVACPGAPGWTMGGPAADLGRAARGAGERQDKKQCGGCRALHQGGLGGPPRIHPRNSQEGAVGEG